MKKTINLLAIAAVAFAAVWSCAKAEMAPEDNNKAEAVIEAVLADSQATKTSVDNSGKVFWESRDTIMVFFGDYAVPFVSYNSEPVDKALFVGTSLVLAGGNEGATGSVDGYTYWSVYPMQTRKAQYIPTRDSESVFAYVDPVQVAKAGTFDKSTFVTVARSTDWKQLSFYNLCGGLRFKVSASNIDMVTFKGNNGEKLAGEVNVKMDQEGHPYPATVCSDRHELQLSAPKGEYFKPGEWYYIVSLPANLTKGYTLTFISSATGKMATKTTSAATEIKRSVFGELDNADAGLTWSEGFDPAELEGMEDLIDVTGIGESMDDNRAKLEVVYHNRYIQQLLERVGASFYVYLDGSSRTFNTKKYMYAVFNPSIDIENGSSYDLQSKVSYEEYWRLEKAVNAIHNQMYLAVAEAEAQDLSAVKLYRVKGEEATRLRNGDYLGSSEDESEHYFWTSNWSSGSTVYSVVALTVSADKAFARKAINLSESLLKNDHNSHWLVGRTLYLSGTYNDRPMIEAFGLDGSYKNATIELEDKYSYNGSERLGEGSPYLLVRVYNREEEHDSVLVYKVVYESSLRFERVAEIPGDMRDFRKYGENVIISTEYSWGFISENLIKAYTGRLDWAFWEMIEQYGYLYYVSPIMKDYAAVYVKLDPYNAQLTEKQLVIPDYNGDIRVVVFWSPLTFVMQGNTVSGDYVNTLVDLLSGEIIPDDETNRPTDSRWNDYWYFDRQYWAVIGSWSSWETDYVMAPQSQSSVYTITIPGLNKDTLFKFRKNYSWNYDDNLGAASDPINENGYVTYNLGYDASNLVIPEDGDWVITLDLNEMVATLRKE